MVDRRQLENVPEADHYETCKTIIEICNASDINFTTLWSVNVDMVTSTLHTTRKISVSGRYKDGAYFTLMNDKKELVDTMVK